MSGKLWKPRCLSSGKSHRHPPSPSTDTLCARILLTTFCKQIARFPTHGKDRLKTHGSDFRMLQENIVPDARWILFSILRNINERPRRVAAERPLPTWSGSPAGPHGQLAPSPSAIPAGLRTRAPVRWPGRGSGPRPRIRCLPASRTTDRRKISQLFDIALFATRFAKTKSEPLSRLRFQVEAPIRRGSTTYLAKRTTSPSAGTDR